MARLPIDDSPFRDPPQGQFGAEGRAAAAGRHPVRSRRSRGRRYAGAACRHDVSTGSKPSSRGAYSELWRCWRSRAMPPGWGSCSPPIRRRAGRRSHPASATSKVPDDGGEARARSVDRPRVQFGANFEYAWDQSHLITFADAGIDSDDSNDVVDPGSAGVTRSTSRRSATHRPSLPGRRKRSYVARCTPWCCSDRGSVSTRRACIAHAAVRATSLIVLGPRPDRRAGSAEIEISSTSQRGSFSMDLQRRRHPSSGRARALIEISRFQSSRDRDEWRRDCSGGVAAGTHHLPIDATELAARAAIVPLPDLVRAAWRRHRGGRGRRRLGAAAVGSPGRRRDRRSTDSPPCRATRMSAPAARVRARGRSHRYDCPRLPAAMDAPAADWHERIPERAASCSDGPAAGSIWPDMSFSHGSPTRSPTRWPRHRRPDRAGLVSRPAVADHHRRVIARSTRRHPDAGRLLAACLRKQRAGSGSKAWRPMPPRFAQSHAEPRALVVRGGRVTATLPLTWRFTTRAIFTSRSIRRFTQAALAQSSATGSCSRARPRRRPVPSTCIAGVGGADDAVRWTAASNARAGRRPRGAAGDRVERLAPDEAAVARSAGLCGRQLADPSVPAQAPVTSCSSGAAAGFFMIASAT